NGTSAAVCVKSQPKAGASVQASHAGSPGMEAPEASLVGLGEGKMTSNRRLRTWLLALVLSLLVALAVQVAAAAAKPPNYVALGDSYTAGPFIPLQIPPYGCLKSDHNYPHLALPQLPVASLRDPSCSGAETDDMTQAQNVDPDGPNPPQFNSLDADTRIASLAIGGN